MARLKSISVIVKIFQKFTDEERYVALSEFLRGDAEGAVLAWRAKLCTALAEAGVYPLEKPEAVSENPSN